MDIAQRIREVLTCEAEAIKAVKVTPAYEQAVLALRDCRGKVLTAGMGKAGHIARKFAATLCSTGTPAAFIHPGEAAHGDLGLVAKMTSSVPCPPAARPTKLSRCWNWAAIWACRPSSASPRIRIRASAS